MKNSRDFSDRHKIKVVMYEGARGMGDKLRMLIVDDGEVNRTILKRIFEANYTIMEARNGKEALDIMNRDEVDVILLDIIMPVMDGLEFLTTIRKDKRFHSIPVVVNTEAGDEQSEILALEQGADEFTCKPYNVKILRRRVENVVRKSVLEKKQYERELSFVAERDSLTGSYNRSNFYEKTNELLIAHPDKKFVITIWNIERFKVINDMFGYKVGDMILIRYAAFLKRFVGYQGIMARLEADHFVTCMQEELFQAHLDSVFEQMKDIFDILPVNYPVVSHMGIYQIKDRNVSVAQMCDGAHLALATIRGNYVKRYAYYSDELRKNVLDEQELIGEMEQALENGEFFVTFQPIFDAQKQDIVSAEALVRWRHPKKGVISPALFIPLFERNGFITKLDLFVWENVCKELAREQELGLPIKPVSVNISRIDLYNNDLCDRLLEMVEQNHLDPSNLKVEVTESAYMQDVHQLLKSMETFQQRGFQVLMDDFGSGYSSLNMLKDVPVDVLKLDMNFIQETREISRAKNIIENIVHMAKQMNMMIIAEGVETQRQFQFLKDIGCDCIQGYYFSKPLELQDYRSLI